MDVLIRFGFTIDEIKIMMDTNGAIGEVSDSSIYELIDILKSVGCKENHIKNIFLCNPFYLVRDISEVHTLIEKLYEYGLSFLYILFDSNPYLLNMTAKDFEDFYQSKVQEKMNKDEILDYIHSNVLL